MTIHSYELVRISAIKLKMFFGSTHVALACSFCPNKWPNIPKLYKRRH
jgi:hypothetical protein